MASIRPRSDWNARAPRSQSSRDLTGVTVHHSAGPADQSIRSIQDFHMDTRGWDDIGYNFLIRDGQVWEGRGWDVWPAHDGVNDTVGVCVIGSYGSRLPGRDDLEALAWFIEEAGRRTGSDLVRGHRDSPGASTACPGDELYTWVSQEGWRDIATGGDDMVGLQRGDEGQRVKHLQSMLRRAGFDPGEVDGDYGPNTAEAVLACRKSQGSGVDSGDSITGWAATQIHVALVQAQSS